MVYVVIHGHVVALAGCAPWDVLCMLKHFFAWLVTAVSSGISGAAKALVNALVAPVIKVSVAVPVFGVLGNHTVTGNYTTYLFVSLERPMNVVFKITLYASYAVVLGALIMGALFAFAETGDIVRRGEGFATIKKALIIVAILPFLNRIYDAAALGIATLNHVIIPPKVLASFMTFFYSAAAAVLGTAVFLAGLSVIAPAIVFVMVMLLLGSMRVLLTAALAAVLPLAVALTLIPLRSVREVGMHMVSMLINLLFSTVLAAVLLRFGAEIGAVMHNPHSFVVSTMLLFMMLATLASPAISLVLAPRAGVALMATSYFMGYMARPAMQAVMRTATAAAGVAKAVLPSRVLAAGRYLKHGIAHRLRSSPQPGTSAQAPAPQPRTRPRSLENLYEREGEGWGE